MELIKTDISGVLIIRPDVYEDDRGYFFEPFNERTFRDAGLSFHFVQDNQSMSGKGVLRGLHFQNPPFAQGKLVRVIKGSVLDVAVDIRRNSPTYGRHVSSILDDKNKLMFWIPPGFAHGFLTLEDATIFSYKCTQYYNKASEGSIYWNDPDLDINWNVTDPVLSEKDKTAIPFKNFISQFDFEL